MEAGYPGIRGEDRLNMGPVVEARFGSVTETGTVRDLRDSRGGIIPSAAARTLCAAPVALDCSTASRPSRKAAVVKIVQILEHKSPANPHGERLQLHKSSEMAYRFPPGRAILHQQLDVSPIVLHEPDEGFLRGLGRGHEPGTSMRSPAAGRPDR